MPAPVMGEVRVVVTVGNLRTGARSGEITALADTGSTLTWIPRDVLAGIDIRPMRRTTVELLDGRRMERDTAEALVELGDDATASRVVFGEPGDATVLGLTVLEQLGLAVDPVHRCLVPAIIRA
jgi:predicted aspartyl protease